MGKSEKQNRSLIKFLNNTMESHLKLTHSKLPSPLKLSKAETVCVCCYITSTRRWRLDQSREQARHVLACWVWSVNGRCSCVQEARSMFSP